MSPLYSAAMFGHLDAFRLLVHHGADVHTRNKNDWSKFTSESIVVQPHIVIKTLETASRLCFSGSPLSSLSLITWLLMCEVR